MDDALSVEELPGNKYKVGVHIADVSYFVGEGTTIDEIAQRRATSVYLVQEVRFLFLLSRGDVILGDRQVKENLHIV